MSDSDSDSAAADCSDSVCVEHSKDRSSAVPKEPSTDFFAFCALFPWIWLSVFFALFSRLAHFLNDRNLMYSGLVGAGSLGVPVVFFVTMVLRSSWFRKNWFSVLFVWFLTPIVWFAMGLTQGAFAKFVLDPWIFQK